MAGGLLYTSFQFGAALGLSAVTAVNITATDGGVTGGAPRRVPGGPGRPLAAALIAAAVSASGLRTRRARADSAPVGGRPPGSGPDRAHGSGGTAAGTTGGPCPRRARRTAGGGRPATGVCCQSPAVCRPRRAFRSTPTLPVRQSPVLDLRHWPLYGLRLRTPRLELRLPGPELLDEPALMGARLPGVRREVETGSRLGLPHQGRGFGTEMRAAALHLALSPSWARGTPSPRP